MDTFLRQIEKVVASMTPDERERIGQALAFVIVSLKKYRDGFTAGAFLKFLSLWGVAMGTDGGDRFKAKVKERAAKIGPHVASVFQAI